MATPTKKKSVRDLLRRGLADTEHSPADLAEAVQVPQEYIDDLIAGRRRPPLPARTDVYDRMTSFLKLSRNELAEVAAAERARSAPDVPPGPSPKVKKMLLELCEPTTGKKLAKDRTKVGTALLADMIQRLIDVTQRTVRRKLDDQITLRIAARRDGDTYLAMRLKVLEFLDVTPDTLTPEDVAQFILPNIAEWDVDPDNGALRVVMRGQESMDRHRRTPRVRPAY